MQDNLFLFSSSICFLNKVLLKNSSEETKQQKAKISKYIPSIIKPFCQFSKPNTNLAVRRLLRRLTGNDSDVDLDKSGRLKIPSNLLSDASISKEITIVGLGSYIEVWASNLWEKEQQLDKEEYESNAEQLYYQSKGND